MPHDIRISPLVLNNVLKRSRHLPTLSAVLLATLLAAPTLRAQTRDIQSPFALTDRQIVALMQNLPPESAKSIGALVNGLLSDTTSHMRMATHPTASAADSARAAAVVRSMHESLKQYADVATAERDGFVKFLPWLDNQPIYHYNSANNSQIAATRFDATKPTSLLYRKDENGKMILVGAMYTAPSTATPEQLDARLPLGIAYWHQHVNFCLHRPSDEELRTHVPDSTLVAQSLLLNTPQSCAAAKGVFMPQLFGWMAHVNAFAGDSFDTIWGEEGKDHMSMHKHHGT